MNQQKLFSTIEEALKDQAVADADQVLSDEALHAGGLRPVSSWVRTSASKSALRAKKHREKMDKKGLKQLNIAAPVSAHEALKKINAALLDGRTIEDAMAELVPPSIEIKEKIVVVEKKMPTEQVAILKILAAGGWRASVIRWLADA